MAIDDGDLEIRQLDDDIQFLTQEEIPLSSNFVQINDLDKNLDNVEKRNSLNTTEKNVDFISTKIEPTNSPSIQQKKIENDSKLESQKRKEYPHDMEVDQLEVLFKEMDILSSSSRIRFNAYKTLSRKCMMSKTSPILIGKQLHNQNGFEKIFKDLEDPDRGLRLAATRLICSLSQGCEENQNYILQQKGITLGWLRVFSLPNSFMKKYMIQCQTQGVQSSTKGLLKFIETAVLLRYEEQLTCVNKFYEDAFQRRKMDQDPLFWCYPPNEIEQRALPDPSTHLIGFYLVPRMHHMPKKDEDNPQSILSSLSLQDRCNLLKAKYVYELALEISSSTNNRVSLFVLQYVIHQLGTSSSSTSPSFSSGKYPPLTRVVELPEILKNDLVFQEPYFQGNMKEPLNSTKKCKRNWIEKEVTWGEFAMLCVIRMNTLVIQNLIGSDATENLRKIYFTLYQAFGVGCGKGSNGYWVWSSMLAESILHDTNLQENKMGHVKIHRCGILEILKEIQETPEKRMKENKLCISESVNQKNSNDKQDDNDEDVDDKKGLFFTKDRLFSSEWIKKAYSSTLITWGCFLSKLRFCLEQLDLENHQIFNIQKRNEKEIKKKQKKTNRIVKVLYPKLEEKESKVSAQMRTATIISPGEQKLVEMDQHLSEEMDKGVFQNHSGSQSCCFLQSRLREGGRRQLENEQRYITPSFNDQISLDPNKVLVSQNVRNMNHLILQKREEHKTVQRKELTNDIVVENQQNNVEEEKLKLYIAKEKERIQLHEREQNREEEKKKKMSSFSRQKQTKSKTDKNLLLKTQINNRLERINSCFPSKSDHFNEHDEISPTVSITTQKNKSIHSKSINNNTEETTLRVSTNNHSKKKVPQNRSTTTSYVDPRIITTTIATVTPPPFSTAKKSFYSRVKTCAYKDEISDKFLALKKKESTSYRSSSSTSSSSFTQGPTPPSSTNLRTLLNGNEHTIANLPQEKHTTLRSQSARLRKFSQGGVSSSLELSQRNVNCSFPTQNNFDGLIPPQEETEEFSISNHHDDPMDLPSYVVRASYKKLSEKEQMQFVHRFQSKTLSHRVTCMVREYFIKNQKKKIIWDTFHELTVTKDNHLIKRHQLSTVAMNCGIHLSVDELEVEEKRLDLDCDGYISWKDFYPWWIMQASRQKTNHIEE